MATEFFTLMGLGFSIPSASRSIPQLIWTLVFFGGLAVLGVAALIVGVAFSRFPEATGGYVALTVLVVVVLVALG